MKKYPYEIIDSYKNKCWYNYEGQLHRLDGPAWTWNISNQEEWYLNGIYYKSKEMPLNLFLAYCKWEYKKNGN